MRNRRGFTLVEILVSLVIMLIVSGAIYQMLNSSQRLTRAQAERVSLQSNVRSGALVVPTELRELSTFVAGGDDQNDVLAITGTTDIQYRAMRGIGFVCQTPTATEIRIARNSLAGSWPGYSGYRDPKETRDGLYIFMDGDESLGGVDSWLELAITGVSTGNTCGGAAAISLTVPNTPALTALPLPLRTPVRIYEKMQLQLYVSGGKSWLGAKSVNTGEAFQPVLGPLTDANGLAFEYLDAAGTVTADRKSVKSIRVTVRGITDQAINGGNGSSGAMSNVQDTLVTQVVLRNAFRQ
jgi:prepilin-type N-terminal cleavage/methylation domain-containing protein